MIIDSLDMKYYFSDSKKYDSMPQVIYHYCSLDTLLSIIKNSTIRLSNISKSNDSEEVTYIMPYIRSAIISALELYNRHVSYDFQLSHESIDLVIENSFNELSKNFYVLCFSEERNLLNQWARYADNARGVAIGFNTNEFVKLQVEPFTGYVFGKIVYEAKMVQEKIIDWVEGSFREKRINGNDFHNQNLIVSIINNLIRTMLYYSILYKNPAFFEEREWRLIYNPFGRIKKVMDRSIFYDRILESNSYRAANAGFERSDIQFRTVNSNNISSYIDLNFSSIKTQFIKNIIFGPRSKVSIEDKDLLMFLKINGYNMSRLGLHDTIILSKSDIPYNG